VCLCPLSDDENDDDDCLGKHCVCHDDHACHCPLSDNDENDDDCLGNHCVCHGDYACHCPLSDDGENDDDDCQQWKELFPLWNGCLVASRLGGCRLLVQQSLPGLPALA
jgi:hypothetical protein